MRHIMESEPQAGVDDIVIEVAHGSHAPVHFRDARNPGRWYTAYMMHLGDGVGAGLACWDQQFDTFFRLVSDAKLGHIYADEFRRRWRHFAALLDQTADERYGEGCLAELIDPDDMNRKWFVATLFNASGDYAELSTRAVTACARSVQISVDLGDELRQPVKLSAFARIGLRSAAVGAREGREQVARWTKHLDWLQPFLGSD